MIHTREEVKCVKRGNGMKIIKVKSCVDCPHRALGVRCEETGRETSLPGHQAMSIWLKNVMIFKISASG